jgi:hypothetical protein
MAAFFERRITFLCSSFAQLSKLNNVNRQGDEIGRIFTSPVVVFVGKLFENYKSSPKNLDYIIFFSAAKVTYALIWTKMGSAFLGDFFRVARFFLVHGIKTEKNVSK